MKSHLVAFCKTKQSREKALRLVIDLNQSDVWED